MIETENVPVSALATFIGNPRIGNVELITESLKTNGQYRAIVVNRGTKTGRPMEVLAGNHTLKAAKALGWKEILAHVVDVDDMQAKRIVLVDNRSNDAAHYDNQALLALLETIPADELAGTGYTDIDLDSLLHDMQQYDEDRDGEYKDGAKAKVLQRTIPLDLIFSTSAASSAIALLGYQMGWNPGVITSAANAARLYRERFPRGKPIMFMDNEWHDYDHAQHVNALAEFHPKYATVRDLVTEKVAEEANVEFFTIEETLEMAEEVAEHTENVILIPKYDCLDKLPREIGGKRVVLGYSVESSYGGTEIPPSRFRGWPVHLLGGPWKKQRALLNVLKDDVVSLDNNNVLMVSQFASVCMDDGSSQTLADVLRYKIAKNHMTLSVVLSLANIIHAVCEFYGVEVEDEADAMIKELGDESNER